MKARAIVVVWLKARVSGVDGAAKVENAAFEPPANTRELTVRGAVLVLRRVSVMDVPCGAVVWLNRKKFRVSSIAGVVNDMLCWVLAPRGVGTVRTNEPVPSGTRARE